MFVHALRRALRGPRRLASRAALPLLEGDLPGFAGDVVARIRSARKSTFPDPYFDRWRHPEAKPARFNPTDAANMLFFVRSNAARINRTAAVLADDQSRNLLATLLAFRALGPSHIRLPRANAQSEGYFDRAMAMKVANSPFSFAPFEVARYAVPGVAGQIRIDCWLGNIIASALERQYWFQRDAIRIQPEEGDVLIDAGACFGDTALAFADAVGPSGQVHAFEPVPKQRQVLSHNLAANPELAKRICDHPFATGDKSGKELRFIDGGACAQSSSAGTIPVETLSIDDMVRKERLGKVDFIKMDIEGAETDALRGAAETIERFRPKLAISVYHSLDDLIDLPQLVHSLLPDYRLYLEHHTMHHEETVLYATAA